MTFYIGAHMPVANIIKSFQTIQDLGGNFMQIFINNPRGTANPRLIEKYTLLAPSIVKHMTDNNLKLVIHAPYVINFAAPFDKESAKFKTIFDELIVADMLGAIGCVIHVGKNLIGNKMVATGNMLKS